MRTLGLRTTRLKSGKFTVYTERNNELVEKFQIYRTSCAEARSISNSILSLWKSVMKLPYHTTNVSLIVTSCCNLILSQLFLDHTEVDQSVLFIIAHRTLKKISWWEASVFNPYLDSTHQLKDEIMTMLDQVFNREDTYILAGLPLLYLTSLIYLITVDKQVLKIIGKAIKETTALMSSAEDKPLFIPFFDAEIAISPQEAVKSVIDVAELMSAMGSSVAEQEAQYEALVKQKRNSRHLSLFKSILIQAHLNNTKRLKPSLPDEILMSSEQSSFFSCASSSAIASHLNPSNKPSLVIKLTSLSLREMPEALPILQASSAANLVDQLQTKKAHHLQIAALRSAERYLAYCATSENQARADVNSMLFSLLQLTTVPSPSWAQLKLARLMLLEKHYDAAMLKYEEILNSPLWSNWENPQRKSFHPASYAVLIHEYALILLLSSKLGKFERLTFQLHFPDFLTLILQTELFLRLKMFENAITSLNRAIVELESSTVDCFMKEPMLDACHSKLEFLATCRFTAHDNIWRVMVTTTSILRCPSCGGTLKDSNCKDYHHISKDLAICHLFHEV